MIFCILAEAEVTDLVTFFNLYVTMSDFFTVDVSESSRDLGKAKLCVILSHAFLIICQESAQVRDGEFHVDEKR